MKRHEKLAYRAGLLAGKGVKAPYYDKDEVGGQSYDYHSTISEIDNIDKTIRKMFDEAKKSHPRFKDELEFLYTELYDEFPTLSHGFKEFNYDKFLINKVIISLSKGIL